MRKRVNYSDPPLIREGFVFQQRQCGAERGGIAQPQGDLGIARIGQRGAKWRTIFEKVTKFVPVLGTARHYLALARLAASLEALINAGVTIIEAWEMAAAASGSPALYETVMAWKPQVVAGQTPSEAVNAAPEQFPELFANLYASGEISGQLDESLRRLHTYYQEEGTNKLRILSQWVPKLIYFGVAGMVAFKVISFYTGYFKDINDAINMK